MEPDAPNAQEISYLADGVTALELAILEQRKRVRDFERMLADAKEMLRMMERPRT